MTGKIVRASLTIGLLAAMWGAYPACLLLGLDDSVTVLSHGRSLAETDIVCALITLSARALQCVAAPIATVSASALLVLRWVSK